MLLFIDFCQFYKHVYTNIGQSFSVFKKKKISALVMVECRRAAELKSVTGN